MNTYSTTELAKILKVRPAWVRAQAQRTLVSPIRTERGHYRYSFQDIILLRAARNLCSPEVSSRRVTETLDELSKSLPPHKNLSSLRFKRIGTTILARDDQAIWNPQTGQTELALEFTAQDNVAQLRVTRKDPHDAGVATATDWFNLGLEYEDLPSSRKAEEAYRKACKLDPNHINALINLGRLRHAENALEEAESLYRQALERDARHPIALFNLGVVLEDRGVHGSAIECYKLAIDADPEIAEAHYNLARLYVKNSAESDAIHHYARYKSLTRGKEN